MGDYKDLLAFQKAYQVAMDIFDLTTKFPKEEKYSLTDQIRRSSRSVCTNIGEAYRKRRYPAHFISKLSDAECENTETEIWLQFALDCKYLTQETYINLLQKNREAGKLIWFMINHSDRFI